MSAVLAAVSVAVAAGLAWHALEQRTRIAHEGARTSRLAQRAERAAAESARLRRDVERLDRQQASTRAIVDALTAPATLVVDLRGKGPAAGAKARAFLDPLGRRLFLFVDGLPPPPSGRVYRVWLIAGGKHTGLGALEVAEDGGSRLTSEALPGWSGRVAVEVTEEPEGDLTAPTGPVVLTGGPAG